MSKGTVVEIYNVRPELFVYGIMYEIDRGAMFVQQFGHSLCVNTTYRFSTKDYCPAKNERYSCLYSKLDHRMSLSITGKYVISCVI